jgi:hypothetical protein
LESLQDSKDQAPLLPQVPDLKPKHVVFIEELREIIRALHVLLQ